MPAAGAGTGTTTIRIDPEGSGDGTVVDAALGIHCFYAAGTTNGLGTSCDYDLAHGTTVSLVATASPGSVLVKWIACPGTVSGATCTFAVSGISDVVVVEARFEIQRTLTVSVSGAGTVTSSPVGISCPGDCSETTTGNVAPVLTATPAPGSVFAGWGGDCAPSGLTPTCPLSMLVDHTASASFVPVQTATLAVSLAGGGAGGVTSVPPGISCGSDCAESVAAGATLTLTAEPAPGSAFAGWSGACSGTGACAVTVAGATAVTATFERLPVDARVLSASVVRRDGARVVRVVVDAAAGVSLRLRLERGGRALASRRIRSLAEGQTAVELRLRPGVHAGRARLAVAFANGSGARSLVARSVRVPEA